MEEISQIRFDYDRFILFLGKYAIRLLLIGFVLGFLIGMSVTILVVLYHIGIMKN